MTPTTRLRFLRREVRQELGVTRAISWTETFLQQWWEQDGQNGVGEWRDVEVHDELNLNMEMQHKT